MRKSQLAKGIVVVALLATLPVFYSSCVTSATKADQAQAKKELAAAPENEALKKKVADLEAKATAEKAESKAAIIGGSAVALETISPLIAGAFPGAGLGVAALAALLRRFV
mgnify:CR=1 FL=1